MSVVVRVTMTMTMTISILIHIATVNIDKSACIAKKHKVVFHSGPYLVAIMGPT